MENETEILRRESSISRAIVKCLQSFGYSYSIDDSACDFRFNVRATSGSDWRSQLLLSPEQQIIRHFVYLTHAAHPRQDWVRELVERMNHAIGVLGAFVYDSTAGAYYRCGIDLRGGSVSPEAVERLMNYAGFPLSAWEIAYGLVDNPKMTPEMAADIALLLSGGSDGCISQPVLRSILTVAQGDSAPEYVAADGQGKPMMRLV